MRIALLSDLHANLQALQSVEAHFSRSPQSAERVWFLGDIVDRGADPRAVMLWVRDQVAPEDWVLGNHEAIMMGFADEEAISRVDPLSLRTMRRQYGELNKDPDCQSFMQSYFTHEMMAVRRHNLDGVTYFLSHAGLKDSIGFNRYIYGWTPDIVPRSEFDELEARAGGPGQPGVLMLGHSHVPMLMAASRKFEGWTIEHIKVEPFKQYELSTDRLWLINPGSVGSPRDHDTRASYALLDTQDHSVTFFRLEYDLEGAVDSLINGRYEAALEMKLRDAPANSNTPGEWLAHYDQMRERRSQE